MDSELPAAVAKRQVCKGSLADFYDVPLATFSRGWPKTSVYASILVIAALAYRHGSYLLTHNSPYRPLLWSLLAGSLAVGGQWLISWRDKPVSNGGDWLDALNVTVNIPVFNEAASILDRTIWAVMNQTRLSQRVDVVDDGSSEDYSDLRAYWEGWHGPTEVRWIRQVNSGKKHAQAVTFSSDPRADIFVTIDSDSALESRAIANGLKAFGDSRVTSVAGVVLVANQKVNWITRTTNSRTLLFQVLACGAQSVLGGVLVNRGPLAFYKADVIREIVYQYTHETFFGHQIVLGDDAALTLFCQTKGRTVQQSDSFVFSEYPENMSHHLRQWCRWMRGSTIRNCWRIRYLPVRSYGWWFTLINLYLWMLSLAIPVAVISSWPRSEHLLMWLLGAMVPWGYATGLRILSVRRSDETWRDRWISVLVCPASTLWGLLVLRWVRLYGIATCLKQGWNTRQGGAESLSSAELIGVSS
jgi:hyaluronan synthase